MASDLLTAINLAISCGVIVACACRLRQLPRSSRATFSRAVFVLIIVSAFCNGFRAPLFGSQVGNWWPIIGGASILLLMLEGLFGWRPGGEKHKFPTIVLPPY